MNQEQQIVRASKNHLRHLVSVAFPFAANRARTDAGPVVEQDGAVGEGGSLRRFRAGVLVELPSGAVALCKFFDVTGSAETGSSEWHTLLILIRARLLYDPYKFQVAESTPGIIWKTMAAALVVSVITYAAGIVVGRLDAADAPMKG